MRVVLLTNDTLHHLYFAATLRETDCLAGVVLEAPGQGPGFPTFDPFEALRDEYEKTHFFQNEVPQFSDLADVHATGSVNSSLTRAWLEQIGPEVIVVFGTRRLASETIAIPGQACLNLHGGNPEKYRGLDSHYWTIYHSDFDNLVTTLQHVDQTYDTGPIVLSEKMQIEQGMGIHQVRSANTESCLRLFLDAFEDLSNGRQIPAVPQTSKGRYYSAMPAVLKGDCKKKFDEFTQQIF